MKRIIIVSLSVLAAFMARTENLSPNIRVFSFASDAETEISTDKTYTHVLDFASPYYASTITTNVVVNGVEFLSVDVRNGTAYSFQRDGATYGFSGMPQTIAQGNNLGNIVTPSTENIYQVLRVCNSGSNTRTMKLTGLVPGGCYELRFYNRQWGTSARSQYLTFRPDGDDPVTAEYIEFNQDEVKDDRVIAYRYIVGGDGELAVDYQAKVNNTTFLVYAFTNEEVEDFNVLPYQIDMTDGFVDPLAAVLNATVANAPGACDVTAFWGTEDCGESPDGWEFSQTLPATPGVSFTLNGLDYSGEYHVRLRAVSGGSEVWSPLMSFETLPYISLDPVTGNFVNPANATITGSAPLLAQAGGTVTVCWDTEDAGENEGAWKFSAAVPSANIDATTKAFSFTLPSLEPEKNYFIRAFVQNSSQTVWTQTESLSTTPASGWIRDTAGTTYDFNDSSNWANGVINGLWSKTLAIRGRQYIRTSVNVELDEIRVEHQTASEDTYLFGNGGRRTLTLRDGITHAGMRTFFIGNQANATEALDVDFSGGSPTITVASSKTLRLRNAVRNFESLLVTGGGILYFDGNDMSAPDSEIVLEGLTNLEFNSDRENGSVRADTIRVNNGTLRVSGNQNASSTNRIGTLVFDIDCNGGGIDGLTVYPKANHQTVVSVGDMVQNNHVMLRLIATTLGKTPGANVANIFVDTPPILAGPEYGQPGTLQANIIPWMYYDGSPKVVTYDTGTGIRPLDMDTEIRTYADGYEGPLLGDDENIFIPAGTTITITEPGAVNSIFTSYGNAVNLNGTNTVHVKSGLVVLQPNGKHIINAPLDFTGVQGRIGTIKGKVSEIYGNISGDKGLVFFQTTTERGSGGATTVYNPGHTVTGDIHIHGKMISWAGCDIVPHGEREGDVYVHGELEYRSLCNINSVSGNGRIHQVQTSGGDLVIGHRNSDSVFNGYITGRGQVIKVGTGTLSLTGTNSTYYGHTSGTEKTQIRGGVLEVVSLNRLENPMVSSSLGTPTTIPTATISIGFAETNATLRYLGPGESTDRVINFAGTTGGATLDASGSGAVVFESDFTASANGAKTLTLTGTNTLANALLGIIPDRSAQYPTSLLKTGTGTWVLGGTNTYTGATTVEEGTLLLDDGVVAGSVTVETGGTFGGAGTVQNDVVFDNGAGFAATCGGPLVVGGTAATNGDVMVTVSGLPDVGDITPGTRYLLMDAATISGNFKLDAETAAVWHLVKKDGTQLWLSKNAGTLLLIR